MAEMTRSLGCAHAWPSCSASAITWSRSSISCRKFSSSLHFVDILQAIAIKLGATRSASIAAPSSSQVSRTKFASSRATKTRPSGTSSSISSGYPELQRAFESGETVVRHSGDAAGDPAFRGIKSTLDTRNVRSIVVVPIQWQGTVIGAIFLRTDRDAEPFSEGDVRFCQVVASLTAKALRNAHRFEALLRDQKDATQGQRRTDLQRIALIAFVRRLLDRYTKSDDHMWAETLLPKASDEELERLVTVAMQVIDEEAKG